MDARKLTLASAALVALSAAFWLGGRTHDVATPDATQPTSDEVTRDAPSPRATQQAQTRSARPRRQPPARAASEADAGLGEEAAPGLAQGMTREQNRAQRGEQKAMNEVFAEEGADPKFTAEMMPKLTSFLARIYDESSVRSVECRKSGCFVAFETTEADGVLGLMEQAEQDLGVVGGGAMGGAPVKGKPGRYSFEALFLFERG
jgi:hypothetical protein